MAINNETPRGLEANTWTDDETPKPAWADELLDIYGVERVTRQSHGIVTVDTTIWFDEDDVAESHPELINQIRVADGMSLGGWAVQKVTVKDDGGSATLRLQLSAKTPVCDVEDCYEPAVGEIEKVMLDGEYFTVAHCEEH